MTGILFVVIMSYNSVCLKVIFLGEYCLSCQFAAPELYGGNIEPKFQRCTNINVMEFEIWQRTIDIIVILDQLYVNTAVHTSYAKDHF